MFKVILSTHTVQASKIHKGRRLLSGNLLLPDSCLLSLIRKGVAVPFTAFASPPTLTFPRIKALTAGINPSFIDLFVDVAGSGFIPNFESEATWLKRLYDQNDGRKLIQYGEITWSQLFPTLFERIETSHPVNVMVGDSLVTRSP